MTNTTNIPLEGSQAEAGNATTYIFKNAGIEWTAGQYAKFTLNDSSPEEQDSSHYFTIASAPSEGTINVTTRVSDSAFKQALEALTPGDSIEISQPTGNFTWPSDSSNALVLVAAGIGVTPYRSMLLDRIAHNQPINATLVYFNRTDEIPFLDEFGKLAQEHSEFSLCSIVGEQVTAERILELAPQGKDSNIYLSGPEPMVEAIGNSLKEQGVTLKQDWFPGYTAETF